MPALAVIWAVCHGRGGSFLNTLAWLGEGHHFSSSGRTGLGSDSPGDRAAVEGVPNIRKQTQGNLSEYCPWGTSGGNGTGTKKDTKLPLENICHTVLSLFLLYKGSIQSASVTVVSRTWHWWALGGMKEGGS